MAATDPQPSARVPVGADVKLGAMAVRTRNQRLLLNLIWRDHPISRAELSRVTGLSRSTVSAIVDVLLSTGLVHVVGRGDSQGGRRPVLLAFAAEARLLAGIELGATHVSAVVTDLLGSVLCYRQHALDVRGDPSGALECAQQLVEGCLQRAEASAGQLVGVGVAAACPVDPRASNRLSDLVLPAWRGVDVVGRLSAALGCLVHLDNDANVGALAERWWGAGSDGEDLVYIKAATGIGAGHIVNGAIYRGAGGVAGEIGHLAVQTGGAPCVCGLDGCLTTVVGSNALLAQARALLADGVESQLNGPALTIDRLIAAAVAGDSLASRVIAQAGVHMGRAVASLVNLVNPRTIVIGGGLTRAGEVLMDPLRQTVRASSLCLAHDAVRIVTSQLGEREIAIGAATLILEAALADPALFDARLADAA